jgi:hypothetical protein
MTNKTESVGYSTLLVERHDNELLIVTLNRPDEGNAVAYNALVDTEARLAGVLAWNERRKPVFKGR